MKSKSNEMMKKAKAKVNILSEKSIKSLQVLIYAGIWTFRRIDTSLMLKETPLNENSIKNVCIKIWNFVLKSLYITGLIRIFKLRQ